MGFSCLVSLDCESYTDGKCMGFSCLVSLDCESYTEGVPGFLLLS